MTSKDDKKSFIDPFSFDLYCFAVMSGWVGEKKPNELSVYSE